MDNKSAVMIFQGNWFSRNDASLELTDVEQDLIGAALGSAHNRFLPHAPTSRMSAELETWGLK